MRFLLVPAFMEAELYSVGPTSSWEDFLSNLYRGNKHSQSETESLRPARICWHLNI